MALDGRADSSGTSYRSLHWTPLRSWNLFSGRLRSHISQDSPSTQLPHSQFLRNRGDREESRVRSATSRGSTRGRSTEQSRKGRYTSRRDHNQRGSHGQGGSAIIDDPLILQVGATIGGNEVSHRRRVHREGVFETSADFSLSRTGSRPSAPIAHHQQHHQHQQHDHHHHHYHYHHLYHQPSRWPLYEHQDQDAGMTLTTSATVDSPNHSGQRNTDRDRYSVNRWSSIVNNLQVQSITRDIAFEARERLAERLRGAALLSNRHSRAAVPGGCLDEFDLLFNDDEDTWSDDEMWSLGIQDWLAAWSYGEGSQSDTPDIPSSSEQLSGLSERLIRILHKEIFVPREREKEVGNTSLEQDDCSVCLEHFLGGELLIHLPCKHRFHPDCLIPWLDSHGQCPYCRAKISNEVTDEASPSDGASASVTLMAWMGRLDADMARLTVE